MSVYVQLYLAGFVLLALWGVWIAWRYRTLPGFADEVYDSMRRQGLISAHIERHDFKASYVRAEGPRSTLYKFGTSVIAWAAIPPLIALFNTLWDMVWRMTGAMEGPFERGYMLHLFLTFVFVMGVIVAMLYLVTRLYYSKTPPTLRSELRRLEGQSL